MKTRLPGTLGRFAALFLVVGAFACGDGETKPEPPSNQPPVALGDIPPQTLFEGDEFQGSVDALFSDPDGDALTYSATSSNSGVVTASISGSIITVEAVAEGTATVTVTATDPDGASASLSVSFTVLGRNESPVVTDTIPPQNLTEGDTVTLDVSGNFSDPDGDELTFTVESTNTNAATATIDGSVVTIIAVAEGMAIVAVTATDPDDAFALQEVMVTVEAANRAPVAVGTIPDAGLAVGEEVTAPVVQFFSDPDGDELTYAAVSGDTMVVTASMAGSLITVVGVGAGETTITVTATDPEGLSATQTANFTVIGVNQGPVISDSIPAQSLTVGDTVVVDAANHFSDPDGDELTFEVQSTDMAVVTATLDGTVVTMIAVGEGTAIVAFTATDPDDAFATQEVMVSVVTGNRAPVAVGEVPDIGLLEDEEFTAPVDPFFSDPDGDELTYAAVSGDTTVVTASMSGTMITVVALAEGETTITLTATDPGGLSATQTATVRVVGVNNPPVVVEEIPHATIAVGDTLTLDVSGNFSDPDGDELAFTVESDDTTVATVSVDGSTVTVVGVAPGAAIVGVTATDPGGLSVTQAFAVTVQLGNQSPMAVGEIAAQTVEVGESATVDVSGNFSDPDDDELIYMAGSSDDDIATASLSGAEVTVTGVAAGSATVTVTATDPGDLSATQTFDVTVVLGNQAPEAVDTIPVHDVFIVLDTLDMTMTDTLTKVVLDMSDYFSDPDGDELMYMASTVLDTMAAVESVEGSVVTTIAVAADTALLYDTTMLMVTATDPDGLSVTQEAMVRVAASDYEVWDDFLITDQGSFVFAGFGLSGCFPVENFPFGGLVYTVHWSEWQVKKGSGWVQVPGTYKELEVCAYDLTSAPDGTYRLVGDVSIRPLAGTEDDWVRARRKSENEQTVGN